ncbi:MAG: ABC transporter permease [Chloroflexi bacterium]|nr:ABC transporter permease [Chloroflexota bacterium]MBV9602924.1 ABC transporter permease [Chloroflexota bacterium]
MYRWLIRRILISIPVLLGITVLSFCFVRLAPGDPVRMMINPEYMAGGAEDFVARKRAELGLDQPLPIQYVAWLGEVAQGNLGYSFFDRRPVGDILKERIWPTTELMGTALLLALAFGVPLGLMAAIRQYSALDYASAVISLATISTPSFFLGLAAIYVFSLKLDLLPTSGMFTAGEPRSVGDDLHHLILPAVILGLNLAGPFVRYARASLLEVIRQDYLTTAKSKGLQGRLVILRHALPNALLPLITVIGIQIPALFAGAVVIEQIFAWPGMGQLALAAITQRDYPVLMGFTMIIAVLVLLSNLCADIAYAVVDPRIRLQ